MTADSFRRCYGKLPEATLLLSTDARILEANASAQEFLRCAGSLPGRALQELVLDAPEKLARLLELCRRSSDLLPGSLTFRNGSTGGFPCRVEGALFCPTPDTRFLLLRLFLKEEATRSFRTLNERIDRLNREVLERKRVEALLHAQRELLHATLSSIGDGVIATDASGIVTFLNPIAQSLTGWTQQQGQGKPLEELFIINNEHTGGTVENPATRALREGRIVGLANHTVLTSKDGKLFPIDDSAAPIRNAAGQITGVVLVFRDVSAGKQAEQAAYQNTEALRSSEQTYRAIGESIKYGVWVCAPDGKNIYASESFLQLVGITQQECSDFGWKNVLHPDDAERTIEAWKECVRTGGTWNIEHRFRGTDGQYHWVLARGVPVYNDQGVIVRWAGLNLDIDQVKAGEENLRTSERGLRSANEALVRANEDLKQFAYAASHDLQEPLRMITSYSQLLIKAHQQGRDEEAILSMGIIREGTDRMQELLTDLLAYTEVGADGEPSLELIDLNVSVHKARENLKTAIDETGALVTSDPLPTVQGQNAHFVQLFQNLLENALKYRTVHPPRIHVSAGKADGRWRVGVSDNGIGIDPHYHERVFGVFKRLHGKTIPGTGIGLAICQRVVERYGGHIWVESQLGQGATFYFTLPAARENHL